jgi:hypothetical protein
MPSENEKKRSQFIRWLLAAIGAIVLTVASLWVTDWLGPSKKIETHCLSFETFLKEPTKQEMIRQKLEEFKSENSKDQLANKFAADFIYIEYFEEWAAECGKAHVPVVYSIHPGILLRIESGDAFFKQSGQVMTKCRRMYANIRLGPKWSNGVAWQQCLQNGEWQSGANAQDLTWLYSQVFSNNAAKSKKPS